MVLWRSQADEIDALRAEVRNLRGEMAVQQAELEEMDTIVERMVLCDSMAQMQLVLRRATTLTGVGNRSDRGNWCACIGARRKHRIDLFAESIEPDRETPNADGPDPSPDECVVCALLARAGSMGAGRDDAPEEESPRHF